MSRIIILDGGLGTLLCDTSSPEASTSPLWSSADILSRPERIRDIHKRYIDAGARVILTATYQISHDTLSRAGIAEKSDVDANCRTGMKLGLECIADNSSVSVALSLGSFGACLQPSQEYSGLYPSPYDLGGNTALQALGKWHAERLTLFQDQEEFSKIDSLAFETVPWNRPDEVLAIRQLIDTSELKSKKAWISVVYPRAPSDQNVETIVRNTFSNLPDGSAPRGLGVNCTKLPLVREIVRAYTKIVKRLGIPKGQIFLVIYPDGGLTYDVNTKTWSDEEGLADIKKWSASVMEIAQEANREGCWGNVVVGGCCKTTPDHIKALSELGSQ